ncbi:MAG: hypothetical protein GXY19_21040 [Phycisphaerae bacterium]|nr:hypothetical protein [Phycisphaerae bacterium]
MNRWMQRIVVVLEIGGGYMGFVMLVLSRPWAREAHSGWWFPFGVYVGLSVFAIAAGVLLAEGTRRGIKWSAICQVLQIPVVVSSILTYRFVCGLQITAGSWGQTWVVESGIGSTSLLVLGQAVPAGKLISAPGCGVNVVAVCVFLYLLWCLRKTPAEQTQSRAVSKTQADSVTV